MLLTKAPPQRHVLDLDGVGELEGAARRVEELCARCGVERRGFYRRAFEEDSQNSIYRYLLQFSIVANESVLRSHPFHLS